MKILLRRVLLAMGVLNGIIVAGPVSAEESPPVHMEEVLVVAPAIIEESAIDRYSSEVTTVTQEQIQDLNAQDLPSALRRTPGVVISRHNPIGSFGGGEGGSVFIRGQGSSRPGAEIQTAVDGIPKFVSVWTHPLMDVMSVDVVDQIDVYKGAQPLLFGNMAFAAINMKTKRMTEEGYTTRFQTQYGSFNTWIEVLEHGGKKDAFDYYLSQSYRRSDGHRDNADGELQNYFGRAGYQLGQNWETTVVFDHSNNWADDPGSTNPKVPSEGTFKTKDYFTVATLANHYDWGEGYLKFYSNEGNIDWRDQKEIYGLNTLTDYNNYGVRARQAIKAWQGGEILAGIDLDYISGHVDLHDPNPAKNSALHWTTWNILSPYVAVSQVLGSKDGFYAVPSAGVRYFDHDQFESEWGPQVGVTFGYQDTEFHAQYARGVNYPGLYVKAQDDLFMPGDNKWKDLRAERVNHYEAGISHVFAKKVKAGLTYFYDSGRDRIVVDPPPPYPPTFINIEKYTTKGIEGTVSLSLFKDLAIFGGATYLTANPEDLPYTPQWTASAGANYRFLRDYQLSLDALYVGEHYVTSQSRTLGVVNSDQVDAYFLLNGKIGHDFVSPAWKLKGQVFLAGENLTNTSYEQKAGYPMPGISGMLGITFTF